MIAFNIDLLIKQETTIGKLYYYLYLCELQKWLIEKHDLDITVTPYLNEEYDEKQYLVYNTVENEIYKQYYSYEEALEQGLFRALNLIK